MSPSGGQSLSLSSMGVPSASTRRLVTLEKPSQNHLSGCFGTVFPVNVFTRSALQSAKSRMNAFGCHSFGSRYLNFTILDAGRLFNRPLSSLSGPSHQQYPLRLQAT